MTFNFTRYFLLFSFVFGISALNQISAQKNVTDMVFLKNGTIIQGRIIQTDSAKGVRINNDCGSYLFHFQEIDSLKFNFHNNLFASKTKGYYNLSSVGLLFGEGEDGYMPYPSLTSVNGYQFNKHWFAGIGIGFENYQWSVFPLFAQASYYFGAENFTPYAALKFGYTFPLENKQLNNYNTPEKTFGGLSTNPEIGIRVAMGTKTAFVCSLGYHFQKLSYEANYYDYFNASNYSSRIYTNFNRVSLRLGFIFR
jgi:hypothetical protein